MSTYYDLIIVGGGLVGASLACALRHTELKMAVIEAASWSQQQSPPSYDDKVIALSYASKQIFTGIGNWHAIASQASPIRHIHISDQGHFGFAHLSHQLVNLPALGYVVRAKHIGHALQATLQDSSVDLIAPAQLEQIQADAQHVEITVNQDEQTQTLHTKLVVAADGGQSQIKRLLDIQQRQYDYQQTAVIANVTLEKHHQYTAYERFTHTGPFALLPLQGNDCSLVWTVKRHDIQTVMAWSDSQFLYQLQQQFGWRLGKFLNVGKRTVYPLRLMQTKSHDVPRVVIIGNAAHTLHPVSGQGLNLGLRDVASLAEVITHYGNIGSQEFLKQYYARQKPDQQQVINLTDLLVHLFSNNLPPLVIARNLGLSVLDSLPFLKKQFIRQMTGLNAHTSHLVRGLSV